MRARLVSLTLVHNKCQTGRLSEFEADILQKNMNMSEIHYGCNKFETVDELQCICDAVNSRNEGNSSSKIEVFGCLSSLVTNIPEMIGLIVNPSCQLRGLSLS